jgi:hypothetical protein
VSLDDVPPGEVETDPTRLMLAAMFPHATLLSRAESDRLDAVLAASPPPPPEPPLTELQQRWRDEREKAREAGPPQRERPRRSTDAERRVVDACRVSHGPWVDHDVAMQPLSVRESRTYRAMPEDVMALTYLTGRIVENGWSWYPQGRDGERRPVGAGRVSVPQRMTRRDGSSYMGSRSAHFFCSPSEYRAQPPGPIVSGAWVDIAPMESNVALQMCAANRHLICVDNDVTVPEVADDVDRLRLEHLGATPYDRVRADSCKRAHLYRYATPEDAATKPRGIDLGDAGAVEILGDGRQITWHGRHWKTGAIFRSTGPLPGMDPGATPDRATMVTAAQVAAFRAAILARFAHLVPKAATRVRVASPAIVDGVVDGEPVRRLVGLDYAGCTRDADGLMRHQRDEWIWRHAGALARANIRSADAAVVAQMVADVLANCAISGSYSETTLTEKATEKVVRCLKDCREYHALRGTTPRTVVVDGRELVPVAHVPARFHGHRDMRALVPHVEDGPSRAVLTYVLTEADETKAAERALISDRTEVQAAVSVKIKAALTAWVRALYDSAMGVHRDDVEQLSHEAMGLMLVRGPTGSGKTSMLLEVLRTEKGRARAAGFAGRVTVAMMLPNYSLLDDVQLRLDDAERGQEVLAEAARMGLDVMQYRGKGHTCGRKEEHDIVAAAGLGTAGMCESTSLEEPDGGGKPVKVTRRCPVWKEGLCLFQAQKERIARSDLVLLPTAYVTLPCPSELTDVAALVIDESVISHFERTATLDLDVLKLARAPARLTRAEKGEAEVMYSGELQRDAWASYQDHMRVGGAEACDIVHDCIMSGRDVAAHLLTLQHGYDLAQTALSVCGRASDVHDAVTVDLDVPRARMLANRQRDVGLLPEIRFWRLVTERMDMLLEDAAVAALHERRRDVRRRRGLDETWYEENAPVPKAKGARDYRLRTLTDLETGKRTLSMSWRPANRFGHVPTLLLDASADVQMLEKVWGRKPHVVDAPAPLHLRTLWVADRPVSLRSRLPYKAKDLGSKIGSARALDKTRDLIAGMAGVYGHSRVCVSAPKQLEVALRTGWVPPGNVDWIHDGATVGLDFARLHECVLVIGQTDLPVHAVDARAACWTYDDEIPEEPLDRLGTGADAEGNEVRCPTADVTYPMRDGRDVTVPVRCYEGTWARRVQLQTREEQQRQGVGRVRPVYKDGSKKAPLFVMLGQVLASGIVIDEMTTQEALLAAVVHHAEAHRDGALPVRDGMGGHMPTHAAAWERVMKAGPELLDDAEAGQTLGLSRFTYTRANGLRQVVMIPAHADPIRSIARWEAKGTVGFDPARANLVAHPANEAVRLAYPRPVDAKMVALLGEPGDAVAAEAATLAMVREMDAARAWPLEVFRAGLSDGAKGALLTVRPRTEDDRANKLDTLRNPDAPRLPEPVVAGHEPVVVEPAAEPEMAEPEPVNDALVKERRPRTIGEVWSEPHDEWDDPICKTRWA